MNDAPDVFHEFLWHIKPNGDVAGGFADFDVHACQVAEQLQAGSFFVLFPVFIKGFERHFFAFALGFGVECTRSIEFFFEFLSLDLKRIIALFHPPDGVFHYHFHGGGKLLLLLGNGGGQAFLNFGLDAGFGVIHLGIEFRR